MPPPKNPTRDDPAEPRWLSSSQLTSWRSFSLMIFRLQTSLETQLQRDSQLSFVEYHVLAGLSDQPDHRMRMSDLAVLVNAEQSRLSHLITRLEKREFVRREPDPCSGRYTNAVLTKAGCDYLIAAAPGHVARVRDLVVDAIDASSLRTLGDISDQILRRIDESE